MAGLYHERAELYDVVYQWKDYAAEAERVRSLLVDRGVGPGSRVLEAACGTGRYLELLQADYRVAGFDLGEGMLAVARRRLPGVPLWHADMATVTPEQVDGPYDAVVCLFSSIGYLFPEARLQAALRRFAALLRPGGVLVLEPWLDPDAYRVGRPNLQTAGLPDLDAEPAELLVARGGVSALREQDGLQISVMDLSYLVIPAGGVVETFTERHELWLCPAETMQRGLDAAGFDVERFAEGLMPGRGLFVGRRRGG